MATYPAANKVLKGEVYGPNDDDYTGTLDVEAAEVAAAAAQLATDVSEVENNKGSINSNCQILGVFGTDQYTPKTLS